MKGPARFEIVVWLICCAFLFAQSNPTSTEQKQETPALSSGSPSQAPSADGHAPPSTPPGATTPLMNICAPHQPTPSRCATPPHAVFAPNPEYSEEARKAHYEGTCVLWAIVGTDGRVQNTKVARRLGHCLDEKAIEAVKLWKFEPAMYEGKPVAVQINIEVTFRTDDVVVSPTSAQLVTGAKQQFSATVSGATNSAVKWSVGSSGCAASACGSISTDGLYTAPLSVPNPAAVIVTATSATDPIKMGSAKVTILPSPSQ
jgi:TonB family protein